MFHKLYDMPLNNHLPSTDHLLPTQPCKSSTLHLFKAEQDSGRLLSDEYGLSLAAQYHASDSISPIGRFYLPTTFVHSKIIIA